MFLLVRFQSCSRNGLSSYCQSGSINFEISKSISPIADMNQLLNVGSVSANLSVSQASKNVVHAIEDTLTPFANVFGIEEGQTLTCPKGRHNNRGSCCLRHQAYQLALTISSAYRSRFFPRGCAWCDRKMLSQIRKKKRCHSFTRKLRATQA